MIVYHFITRTHTHMQVVGIILSCRYRNLKDPDVDPRTFLWLVDFKTQKQPVSHRSLYLWLSDWNTSRQYSSMMFLMTLCWCIMQRLSLCRFVLSNAIIMIMKQVYITCMTTARVLCMMYNSIITMMASNYCMMSRAIYNRYFVLMNNMSVVTSCMQTRSWLVSTCSLMGQCGVTGVWAALKHKIILRVVWALKVSC